MEEGSLKRLIKNRKIVTRNKNGVIKTMRQSSIRHNFTISLISIAIIFSIGLLPNVQGKLTISKECGDLICKPHNYCSSVDHFCRPCQVACDPALGNYDKAVCEKDCQDYLHDLWYMRKPENESEFRDELYIDLYYKVQEDLRLLKILIGVVIILSTVVMLALFGIMIYFKRLRNKLQQQQNINNPYHHKQSKKFGDYPVIYSNSKVLSLPIPDIHKGPPSSSHVSSSINNNLSRGSSPDLVSRTVVATTQASSYNNSSASLYHPKSSSSKNKDKSLGLRGGGGGGFDFVMENPMIMTMNTPPTTQKEKQQSRLRKEPSESTLPEYQYDNPALVPSPVHM